MFTADDIIYAYTREDAINDGVFIEVNEIAREAGFTIPVCVTANLYHKYVKPDPMPECQDEQGRLWDLIWMCSVNARNSKSDMIKYQVIFDQKEVTVWAKIEAQSRNNPAPAITIMLPEDN